MLLSALAEEAALAPRLMKVSLEGAPLTFASWWVSCVRSRYAGCKTRGLVLKSVRLPGRFAQFRVLRGPRGWTGGGAEIVPDRTPVANCRSAVLE